MPTATNRSTQPKRRATATVQGAGEGSAQEVALRLPLTLFSAILHLYHRLFTVHGSDSCPNSHSFLRSAASMAWVHIAVVAPPATGDALVQSPVASVMTRDGLSDSLSGASTPPPSVLHGWVAVAEAVADITKAGRRSKKVWRWKGRRHGCCLSKDRGASASATASFDCLVTRVMDCLTTDAGVEEEPEKGEGQAPATDPTLRLVAKGPSRHLVFSTNPRWTLDETGSERPRTYATAATNSSGVSDPPLPLSHPSPCPWVVHDNSHPSATTTTTTTTPSSSNTAKRQRGRGKHSRVAEGNPYPWQDSQGWYHTGICYQVPWDPRADVCGYGYERSGPPPTSYDRSIVHTYGQQWQQYGWHWSWSGWSWCATSRCEASSYPIPTVL